MEQSGFGFKSDNYQHIIYLFYYVSLVVRSHHEKTTPSYKASYLFLSITTGTPKVIGV